MHWQCLHALCAFSTGLCTRTPYKHHQWRLYTMSPKHPGLLPACLRTLGKWAYMRVVSSNLQRPHAHACMLNNNNAQRLTCEQRRRRAAAAVPATSMPGSQCGTRSARPSSSTATAARPTASYMHSPSTPHEHGCACARASNTRARRTQPPARTRRTEGSQLHLHCLAQRLGGQRGACRGSGGGSSPACRCSSSRRRCAALLLEPHGGDPLFARRDLLGRM